MLFCDEVDCYLFSVGVEGDFVNFVKKRMVIFWNWKIVLVLMLMNKGLSWIEVVFEESD